MHVYGGNTFVSGKQVRAVVACKRSELPALIGGRASKSYARNYWSMTGNTIEIQVAMSRPGVLFYRDPGARSFTESDYHPIERQ